MLSQALERVKSAARRRPGPGGWAALAILLLLWAAVGRDPRGVTRFFLGFAYGGVIVDAAAWEAWASENRSFFGALRPGARFAFVEDVSDSTGVVFEKTSQGMTVERTHLLRFSDVPIVIALEPTIAAEIQTLSMAKDGDRFWDGFKNLARRRKIRAYRVGSQEETERLGIAEFFRNIDVYDENDGPAPHD